MTGQTDPKELWGQELHTKLTPSPDAHAVNTHTAAAAPHPSLSLHHSAAAHQTCVLLLAAATRRATASVDTFALLLTDQVRSWIIHSALLGGSAI